VADAVDDGSGQGFADAMAAQMEEDLARLEGVLTVAAVNLVAWLRSLTDELRPPVGARIRRTAARSRVTVGEQGPLLPGARRRRITVGVRQGPVRAIAPRSSLGTGRPRPAHPGHWADVNGLLAGGYAWEVRREGNGFLVTFSNPVEYAAKLEQREGFWVLRGVVDPGGPFQRELDAAIAKYAPDLRVERA